jgi:hypothetical protein
MVPDEESIVVGCCIVEGGNCSRLEEVDSIKIAVGWKRRLTLVQTRENNRNEIGWNKTKTDVIAFYLFERNKDIGQNISSKLI